MNALEKLFRVIGGETVFGLDIDTKLRQAANELSARLLVEQFKRCDVTAANWPEKFAEALSVLSVGDPSALIGFDDGRWEDLPEGYADAPKHSGTTPSIHFIKLVFTDADAAYYQFHLFPPMDLPYVVGGGRKREGARQHLRLELTHAGKLETFIQLLRQNPHFVGVEPSSEEEFRAARSESV